MRLSDKEQRILAELGEDIQQLEIDSIQGSASDAAEVIQEEVYTQEQAKELAEKDLNFLGGLAMPTVFQFLFPPVLLGVWAILTREVMKIRAFPQIALGIPRGHAKTTLIKLFVLWCILFTNKKFILVVGRTGPRAQNILSDIVDMLNERNIINIFGIWDVDIVKDQAELKQFTFRGRKIILAALGAGGSVRGMNLNNERPDVIIFEDIQDAEDAKSEVISNALVDWMIGTAMKAKSPLGCLTVFVGNMFPGKFCILRQLKDNPKWVKFISGAILADSKALWEDLRPLSDLMDEFENDMSLGKPEIFLSEVMNDTDSVVSSQVDTSKIKDWPWGKDELCQGKMIIIDPSTGKKGKDPVSIGYFEVYDGIPGLRTLQEGEFSPSMMISLALIMALRTGTKVIVVEDNAYQATALHWFEVKCKELNIEGIHCVPINSTQVSKNARIFEMIKGLMSNEQAIHSDVRSAVTNQLVQWKPLSRNNNDGILDLLAYAPRALRMYEGLMLTVEDIIIKDFGSQGTIEGAYAF